MSFALDCGESNPRRIRGFVRGKRACDRGGISGPGGPPRPAPPDHRCARNAPLSVTHRRRRAPSSSLEHLFEFSGSGIPALQLQPDHAPAPPPLDRVGGNSGRGPRPLPRSPGRCRAAHGIPPDALSTSYPGNICPENRFRIDSDAIRKRAFFPRQPYEARHGWWAASPVRGSARWSDYAHQIEHHTPSALLGMNGNGMRRIKRLRGQYREQLFAKMPSSSQLPHFLAVEHAPTYADDC